MDKEKINFGKLVAISLIVCLVNDMSDFCNAQEQPMKWPKSIQMVLDHTTPLEFDRNGRLPLYLWQAMAPEHLDEKNAEKLVSILDERGVGLVGCWNRNKKESSLAHALMVARAQKKLGLQVNINANPSLYSYFNGDPRTAHIDEKGEPFFDESFGKKHKMGCPFAIDFRRAEIRQCVRYFAEGFKKAGVAPDFVFADWEIDGPIEFNEAHAASKRCQRCRKNINNIDDFGQFQKVLREIRCDLQRRDYVEPIKKLFPKVLVGNYAAYPHDGYRYWFDYYEYYVDGQPYKADQRAKYRNWYHEFDKAGYTFAMPTVYPWRRIYHWYDYSDTDYRWFYNMLLVASNAGKNTPADIPIISFVHWHTVIVGPEGPAAKQFSEEKYQELLWHMLLRGTDTFYLWCRYSEAEKEIPLVHTVYAQAQRYGKFLSNGAPINFDVPKQPGTVISGLKLGNQVLVRRTDFKESTEPVEITIDGRKVKVEPAPGRCQIILLQ